MPVLWTDELAAELLKQPRAPVALEVGNDGDVYGAAAVYTEWADDNTQLCVVSALHFPKGKAPWESHG